MNDLIFKNVIVEVLVLNEVPFFNPYHVGMCLGLSESTVRDHLAKMNEKQVVKLTNSIVDRTDFRKLHNTGENFLTESGVYKLIFKSNKEQAEEFQNWVTDDVLPQIRQTGGYITGKEKLLLQLFSDDKVAVANAHKMLVELEKAPLIAKIEEQAPQVEFANAIADSETLINISELAKILNQNGIKTGQNRLFEWLRAKGYLMRRGKNNIPTQKSIDLKVMKVVEKPYQKPNGEKAISLVTKITPKGQQYFINKLNLG